MKRGAALPMVLMSLGLVGALTVGGAFVARRFVADARNGRRALELGPAAEQAMVGALGSIDWATLASHPPGSSIPASRQVTPTAVISTWATVLGPESVWVVAEVHTTSKPMLYKRLGVVGQFIQGESGRWQNLTWFELP